jgi:hypothetical protein
MISARHSVNGGITHWTKVAALASVVRCGWRRPHDGSLAREPRGEPSFRFPALEVSTNLELSRRRPGWIDFDAGVLATGADRAEIDGHFLDLV